MASKFDYLRNRPFLVIDQYLRPNGAVRTERKGWQTHGGTHHDAPSIAYRISHLTLRRAAVIIDLLNNRVIKNRQQQTMMFDDEVLAHYKTKCAQIIQPAMGIYA